MWWCSWKVNPSQNCMMLRGVQVPYALPESSQLGIESLLTNSSCEVVRVAASKGARRSSHAHGTIAICPGLSPSTSGHV